MRGYVSEIFASFQGEGAHVGRRHLFVRLAGCNIRCSYCDTPDSLERTSTCRVYWPQGHESLDNPIGSGDLARLIGRWLEIDPYIDAIAVTGGEPLVQADFLAATINHTGLLPPILLETNGMLPKRLAEVIDQIDIVSMDIKLPSNSGERPFWDEHGEFLRHAAAKQVYVKILVDDGTAEQEVQRALRLVHDNAPAAAAFLQPITDRLGQATVHADKLAALYRCGRAEHNDLRVVPQTHKMIGIQ